MVEKLDIAAVYAGSLSVAQKKHLLAIYADYICLVRNLEHLIKECRQQNLAARYYTILYKEEGAKNNYWHLGDMNSKATEAYDDFINRGESFRQYPYSYVSLNTTFPENEENRKYIISAPSEYTMYNHDMSFPTRVERWVAAFPKDQKLNEAKFVVDGKWLVEYLNKDDDRLLEDAINDDAILQKQLMSIFETIALAEKYKCKDVNDVTVEVLVSTLVAAYEGAILDSLASLTEEHRKAFKKMLSPLSGENYISKAENLQLIPSASAFQDYMNIRHLIHHQWDTLDGFGRFNIRENEKNTSIRKRFLESYAGLCGGKIMERIDNYIKVANDFAPFIQSINPHFFKRGENESNNKFINRIRDFVRAHPEEEFFVEMNYGYNKEKKASFIKHVQKISKNAKFIDETNLDYDTFYKRTASYLCRSTYLQIMQKTDCKISQHCLFCGHNFTTAKAWEYMHAKKFVFDKEMERWNYFRKLRNDLSHNYLKTELLEEICQVFSEFANMASQLERRVNERVPSFTSISENIIMAEHKSGKVVYIDYTTHTIVNKEGQPIHQPKETKQGNQHIEDYPNGMQVIVQGIGVVGCRLKNGVFVDLQKQKIIYPNGSKLYFKSKEANFFVMPDNVRMITDKKFKTKEYIVNGRPIQISKKETVRVKHNRSMTINEKGRIAIDELNLSKNRITMRYTEDNDGFPVINFDDATRIVLKPGAPEIWHKNIKLEYKNRKSFVQSYNTLPNTPIVDNGRNR